MKALELSGILDDLEAAQLYDNSSGQKVVEGRGELTRHLCKEQRRAMSKDREVVHFIDGLPGSGKSGLAEKIVERVTENGILEPDQVAQIALDLFIGTEHDSDERARLTDDPRFFAEHYMRYRLARDAVAQALEMIAANEGGKIPLPRAYDRTQGGIFAPHEINIPRHTKLLIVEGTGAISQIARYDGIPRGIVPTPIYVSTSIREALFGGTLRDVLKGGGARTFEKIYYSRVEEYIHLVPWARDAIQRATKICLRYPEENSFNARLVRKEASVTGGIEESRLSVSQVLASLDPDFLKAIYPGEVPMALSPAFGQSSFLD